jgi:hypothetical protein
MAKQKIVAPVTAMALAKQAAPNATKEERRAIADNILKINDQKKGQEFKAGETVRLGAGIKIPSTPTVTPDYSNVRLYSPGVIGPVYPAPSQTFTNPTPSVPAPAPTIKDTSTKSATPDIILEDESSSIVDVILSLTLEKIGGQELINIARHDTVNGQNIIYQPIKNISDIAIAYNPQNMISFPDSSDNYFKSFPIKLEAHIPQYEGLVFSDQLARNNNVFLDLVNNNIIIENINMKRDYDVEIQMLSSGKVFNDTIYDEDSI